MRKILIHDYYDNPSPDDYDKNYASEMLPDIERRIRRKPLDGDIDSEDVDYGNKEIIFEVYLPLDYEKIDVPKLVKSELKEYKPQLDNIENIPDDGNGNHVEMTIIIPYEGYWDEDDESDAFTDQEYEESRDRK